MQCRSVRGSKASVDDEFAGMRRRVEKLRRDAVETLEGLKRYLQKAGQPETRADFSRMAIRLEVARERMLEAAGEMK